MDETQFLDVYFSLMALLFGACIGSFLNVVIYRIPAGLSVVKPRSHCKCGRMIAWYDNIPVLSWFILRGRCRHCGQGFSIRYPLVEAGTALVFLGLWRTAGFPDALVWMVFAGMMIPAAFIDLDTMEIPDRFSIGGFIAGLILSVAIPSIHGVEPGGLALLDAMKGATAALMGAFIGSGLLLWVALVAEVVLRKEAMGFGDVKLMGAIGAFCGWQGAVFAFFGGSIIGCLLLLLLWPTIRKADPDEGRRIPFGPALVMGAFLYLLFAKPYVTAYFAELADLMNAF